MFNKVVSVANRVFATATIESFSSSQTNKQTRRGEEDAAPKR